MASNRRKKSLDLLDESVAGQSVQNTFAEKVNKPCSVSVIAVEETGAKLDSVRGYEMEGTELKCEKNSGLELAKEEADPISNSRVNDASSQRTKEGLLSCKSNVDIKIEVLNKRTISNYVRKIITSTDLYSQNSDNSIVNEKCGDFECRSTFLELQKINGKSSEVRSLFLSFHPHLPSS